MSKSVNTPVAPKTVSTGEQVRAYAVEQGLEVKQTRGRLPKAVIEAFDAAHPDAPYAPGGGSTRKPAASSATVTLAVVKRNSKGARLKRPQTVSTAEARRLGGAPAKGRIASKHLEAAARAWEAENFGSVQG